MEESGASKQRAPMSENGIELAAVAPSPSCSNGQRDDGSNGCSVDGRILKLSQKIVHEMEASRVPRPPKPEIYRVPEMLLAADKEAYQPTFVSLGPYHYHRGDFATEDMRRNDEKKLQNLDECAIEEEGGRGGAMKASVEEYMKVIASIQADARSRYDGDVIMEWHSFCRMLLLDGFQLMTLLEWFGQEPPEAEDPGIGCNKTQENYCRPKTAVLNSIGHDLMMLENQIPLLVVEKLYCLRYGINGDGETGRKEVSELAWRTIGSIMH